MRRWLLAALVLLLGRGRRREPELGPERSLPEHLAPRRAENAVLLLLLATTAAAAGFVVVFVVSAETQLLGLTLGLAFAALAAAMLVASRTLVPQERKAEARSDLEHEDEQAEVARLVAESADGLSRRRLVVVAAGTAGVAITAALVAPVAALGPGLGTGRLLQTPWRPGRRLVDEDGRPLRADDVVEGIFLTAFPEGAEKDTFDAPLILVRLPLDMLELPDGRKGWAPDGVLAFSKICPHAGCAISLYRWPTYPPTSPRPALVCPCHYSTFDPARGGTLLFGPAGRDLPQLPLRIAGGGALEAAGGFSAGVGPSWWRVRQA